MNRHHLGPGGRSMLATSGIGVVMGVATRRVSAVAARQRRPRAATTRTPAGTTSPVPRASDTDKAFADTVRHLLQPTSAWDALVHNLRAQRP